MADVRHLIVLAVVAVAACPARTSRPQQQGDDAAVLPPADAGMDAVNVPDLAIERPPAAVEVCGNGLDDDGDGRVDEGCVCAQGASQDCYPGPMRLAGIGTCAAGKQVCSGDPEFGGWGPCEHAVTPKPEACDGLDNNCDGRVDDGCLCEIGTKRACYAGPAGTGGVGTCRDGMQVCSAAPAASEASGARAKETSGPTATCATGWTTTATEPSMTAARARRATAAPATAAPPERRGWDRARRGGRTA